MAAIVLSNFNKKILVVGPIYDQIHKVADHPDWFSNHDIIIFNGSLCYPSINLDQVRQRIHIMDSYLAQGKAIYNLSNYDLMLMKRLWTSQEAPDILRWLQSKSNVILVEFASGTNVTITGGGLLPNMARSALHDNLETSFVNHLEGRPWHELYDGGCGYIIANNPLAQNRPTYYNYSIRIGTNYNSETNIYAIQASSNGIGNIFVL